MPLFSCLASLKLPELGINLTSVDTASNASAALRVNDTAKKASVSPKKKASPCSPKKKSPSQCCDKSPKGLPFGNAAQNVLWYNRNAGLQDKVIHKKMTGMSRSPVHFHRFNPFLENYNLTKRRSAECNELFPGRSAPRAQIQGDAHLGNFGTVMSKCGEPAFAINDYDGLGEGFVDMDLHRLATSTVLWTRQRGGSKADQRENVRSLAQAYFDGVRRAERERLCSQRSASCTKVIDHVPEDNVNPNTNVSRLLDQVRSLNQREFVASKLTTDKLGNIIAKKSEPMCYAETRKLRRSLEPWIRRLPSAQRNFKIISLTRGLAGGGSSAGCPRYRMVIKDHNCETQIIDIKNAPASSTVEQNGKNQFDAKHMIGVQTVMGEYDPYAGWLQHGCKQFFTRMVHAHKSGESKIDQMAVSDIKDTAERAAISLARAHVNTAETCMSAWVGDSRCEQKTAADRLVNYAMAFADVTVKEHGEVVSYLEQHSAKPKKPAASGSPKPAKTN